MTSEQPQFVNYESLCSDYTISFNCLGLWYLLDDPSARDQLKLAATIFSLVFSPLTLSLIPLAVADYTIGVEYILILARSAFGFILVGWLAIWLLINA